MEFDTEYIYLLVNKNQLLIEANSKESTHNEQTIEVDEWVDTRSNPLLLWESSCQS